VQKASVDAPLHCAKRPASPFQMEALRSESDPFPIEASLSTCNVQGAVMYTFIVRDVGNRMRAERDLRDSQERFQLAVWGSSDGLGDWNFKTGEAYWSPRLIEMLGYSADEFESNATAIMSRMHSEDRDRVVREVNEGARREQPVKSEFRLLTKSGGYRWFQGRVRAVCDERGRAYRFAGALTDISERKQMEEELARRDDQLRQSQKLEVIGSLAGGIAHEFNNLLQAIRGYTKYGMEGLPPDDQRFLDLDQVMKAADRATVLTRQLLGFSRRQVLERANCDPREVITDLLKLLRPVIGEYIDLEFSLAPNASQVYADRGLLEQMLLNLCINARDAMPNGGRLRLKTDRVDFTKKYCESHPTAKPGSYVLFSIADTGHGMAPQIQARIFEPFFTTKEVGRGTGLGLAMVYGVVQQHEGLINVYSEVGLGTTFKIYLPVGNRTDAATSPDESAPVCGGKETILLAEDEQMVRELAVRTLTGAGYAVLAAADGAEAVSLFEAHADAVSLALLDAVMPKLTGHEVFDRLQLLKPGLPVIFCSGYDPDMGQVKSLMNEGLSMIQKPYDPDALLRTVRETLDAQPLVEATPCYA
jgi:two-component system, cell cycle sensor histidine kinase and response regulator CckA